MAPQPSFPTALLRAYTSILRHRTSQLQSQASRLLGIKPPSQSQSQSQDAYQRHFERITYGLVGKTQAIPIRIPIPSQRGVRWRRLYSTDSSSENHVNSIKSKKYEFHHILTFLSQPSQTRTLIDVREPHEFHKNSIPTAINIPISSRPDALLLPAPEFLEQFGFAKPALDTEVVFFCKAGVRSRAAAQVAGRAGYHNIAEYPGSWLDWVKNAGPGTKSPTST